MTRKAKLINEIFQSLKKPDAVFFICDCCGTYYEEELITEAKEANLKSTHRIIEVKGACYQLIKPFENY